MTATHAPFALYSGATWQFDAALHDSACDPLDVTGSEIEWVLYDGQGNKKIELAVGSGITITDPVGGLCTIVVPPEQTTPLAAGNYSDEIRCTLASGFITVQAVGSITVSVAGAPAAPPDLQAQLDGLKAARAQGINSTSIEGFSVQYRTDAEMARAIAATEAELAAASGVPPIRNVYPRSKGWS